VIFAGTPAPDEAIVDMIHLAGGRSARVAILPVAAANQASCGAESLKLFTRFGMRRAEVLVPITREMALDTDWAQALTAFDAAFLCGSDVAAGLALLHGTPLAAALQTLHRSGHLVAGISAGAVLLSEQLVMAPNGTHVLVPGLDLASGLVIAIDVTRGMNPDGTGGLLAAGLGPGTAIVVRDGEAKVLGEGSVTFVDPRDRAVHVLTDGFGLNLRTRKPIAPNKETVVAAAER